MVNATLVSTTMNVSHPTNCLELLPTELFPIIIDHINLDLVAHVYFYKLLPRISACYAGRGRDFWEPICRASGLGCPIGVITLEDEWQKFAFECAEHAATCPHPACGLTRLRENGALFLLSWPLTGGNQLLTW